MAAPPELGGLRPRNDVGRYWCYWFALPLNNEELDSTHAQFITVLNPSPPSVAAAARRRPPPLAAAATAAAAADASTAEEHLKRLAVGPKATRPTTTRPKATRPKATGPKAIGVWPKNDWPEGDWRLARRRLARNRSARRRHARGRNVSIMNKPDGSHHSDGARNLFSRPTSTPMRSGTISFRGGWPEGDGPEGN